MKKNREGIFMIMIFSLLLCGAVLIQSITGGENADELVVQAFQQVEFSLTDSTIEAYGRADQVIAGAEAQAEVLIRIADQLGVTDYHLERTYTEGQEASVLYKEDARTQARVQLVTIVDNGEDKQQYLLITLRLYDGIEEVLAYRECVEGIMKDYETESCVSMELKGSRAGAMGLDECSETADQLLEILSAEIVTDHRSEELFTIYAYSSRLKSYSGGSYDNINVNIAFGYDETEDCTNLYVATPVIRSDY